MSPRRASGQEGDADRNDSLCLLEWEADRGVFDWCRAACESYDELHGDGYALESEGADGFGGECCFEERFFAVR